MWAYVSGKKSYKLYLLAEDKLTLNDPDSGSLIYRLIFVYVGILAD